LQFFCFKNLKFYNADMILTAGIDEAGRGPWAGPVFASIVILSKDQETYLKSLGVHDSKKVSKKKRNELFKEILKNCCYAKVKYHDVDEIDRLGVYIATQEVIRQLVAELPFGIQDQATLDEFDVHNSSGLRPPPLNLGGGSSLERQFEIHHSSFAIKIDGLFPKLKLHSQSGEELQFETIIDGDQKEVAISAASILAKVRRDDYMKKIHELYPQYQFDKHKGYGTKLHLEKLKEHGPCPVHRKSFKPVRELLNP
jgi:ribonuclease HII